MVLRCGASSHIDVDENDVIWQVPPKTSSSVRWPTSSSIATTIPENNDRHGNKQRPLGILKTSIHKIRSQNGNTDDDDDRDCSSTPRTTQSSTLIAGREESSDDECYYPLARLENAGNTPRPKPSSSSSSSSFASSSRHRRGRIQSDTKRTAIHNPKNKTSDSCNNENSDRRNDQRQHQQKQETAIQPQYKKSKDDEQPGRQRRNYHHHHPTACPVCSGNLTYLHISSFSTNNTNNINNIDKQFVSSIACTPTSATLTPVAALCEMKQHDNHTDDEEEEYHKLLQHMCNLHSLLPPLCKTCKTYILFDDDTECKYDMMENFERWYLDTVDDVAVDDDDDDDYNERDERNNERHHGEIKEENATATDQISMCYSTECHHHRAHAKIIVVGGDSITSPLSPSLRAATTAATTAAAATDLSVTTDSTTSTAVADSASLNAEPTTNTVLRVSEEERDAGTIHDISDSQHWEDNITPRLSNRGSRSTLQIEHVDGSVEWGQTASQSEQSSLANSSISDSIQLIHTESEERKILETYSIT
jgi:hypothetical protein